MARGRHTDKAYDPKDTPGADRTGAVLRGAPCFHEAFVPVFDRQPDLVEWCRVCGAFKVFGGEWVAPWLVVACAIKAKEERP